MIIEITSENFNEKVINSEKPVLLDFWAEWCGPCRMLAPTVDAIADEREDIVVGKITLLEALGGLDQRKEGLGIGSLGKEGFGVGLGLGDGGRLVLCGGILIIGHGETVAKIVGL